MALRRIHLKVLAVFFAASFVVTGEAQRSGLMAPDSDWIQWGGPNRNFMSDSKGLATAWPSGGPGKLWTRALGEGHSSILVERGRLYTMYRPTSLMSYVRRSQEEVVAALDAATGSWRVTRRLHSQVECGT
jgi:hypothetical protein